MVAQILLHIILVYVMTYVHIMTSDLCDMGHEKSSCRAALKSWLVAAPIFYIKVMVTIHYGMCFTGVDPRCVENTFMFLS